MKNRIAAALVMLAAATGCEYDDPFESAPEFLGPVSTRSALAWVDQTRHELIFVEPGDDRIDVSRRPIGDERSRVQWTLPTLDHDELLTLVVPASQKEEDVDERLVVFPADGNGASRSYDVLAPFSSVSLTPDRRRAVLHFGGDGGSGVLQNANQVAIVNLDGNDPPRAFTLNGFGDRVNRVEFPGQLEPGQPGLVQIGNRLRDLAVFIAGDEVVVVDMDDEAANQVAVTGLNFSPEETLLRPGNDRFENSVLFLRSGNSADVGMLTLTPKTDSTTGAEGFTVQISLLPIGSQASDFITHDGDEVPYLVTLDPSRQALAFTDIRTQQGFPVSLEGPATDLFVRTHESDTGPVRQLVAWASSGNVIHTLELDGIDDALGRRPRRLQIQTGIDQLVNLDNDRVLVGSGANLYVVDFALEQVTPLSSASPYDPTSSALDGNRLLLGTTGQSWISTVDLVSLNPESMLLDDPIQSFHYLADTGSVVVMHADPVGHLSVARAADPSRSTSYSAWGFLYADMLDRE